MLAILTAVACYPRLKAEHDMMNHPQRFGGKGEDDRRGLKKSSEGRERLGHGSGSGNVERRLKGGSAGRGANGRMLEARAGGGSGRR